MEELTSHKFEDVATGGLELGVLVAELVTAFVDVLGTFTGAVCPGPLVAFTGTRFVEGFLFFGGGGGKADFWGALFGGGCPRGEMDERNDIAL